MLNKLFVTLVMAALGLAISAPPSPAQNLTRDYEADDYRQADRARIDRYLDVEVWTNHSDGEYYEGDNIVISYRANRDAFVVIYSIDTRGRVNLLFPSGSGRDNFIRGGVTYRLPDGQDDFDLVVTGPEGVENIQIVASRERFPIPDWYPTSGLICDWEDRHDYMDYLNDRYFVRYGGQRFAYDRTAVYINEWEEYYFRPVYYPDYYPWSVYGNVYIDYPIGASIYINGFYWGIAPLYIPRLYVGWHTFTIYDYYGYCWESDIHLTRYHSVVLDHHVIRTSPTVASKYKEVRFSGYRNPVSSGYPDFHEKRKLIVKKASATVSADLVGNVSKTKETRTIFAGAKKHVRGSTKLVKTERGLETTGGVYGLSKKFKSKRSGGVKVTRTEGTRSSMSSGSRDFPTKSSVIGKKARSSSGEKGYQQTKPSISSKKSSGYYQKKSGSAYKAKSKSLKAKKIRTPSGQKAKGGKSYDTRKSTTKSGGSSKSRSSYKSRGGGRPSGRASGSSVGKSGGKTSSKAGKSRSGGTKRKR